jgi:hypothetical protein
MEVMDSCCVRWGWDMTRRGKTYARAAVVCHGVRCTAETEREAEEAEENKTRKEEQAKSSILSGEREEEEKKRKQQSNQQKGRPAN